jgi:hypothetical protein
MSQVKREPLSSMDVGLGLVLNSVNTSSRSDGFKQYRWKSSSRPPADSRTEISCADPRHRHGSALWHG